MSQRDEMQKFEQNRIRVLQEERLHIQKKTFTKWMNSFLTKVRMEVEDLFIDLADGKKLLKLLEIISGEKLAKPNNGRMRVHKIENVNKSLAFLHTKVRLESIGAEDIVDGNPRLILGLIWTIILRFQIQEIEIDVDEENESSEKKSAKDALLLWAQRKTNGYANVHITDFSNSWRNGLGFNALIHSHRPDLFDFNALPAGKNIDNLNHAFDVANNELGIPRLLDAEDIDTTRPDEKSIMTYVASYYHTFARMKKEEKSGRRIAKIIKQMAETDTMKSTYEHLTTTLLTWIHTSITHLNDRTFPNSLLGIQTLLHTFGQFRNIEKPPKYIERSEIEALYFNINTTLKSLRQPLFHPPESLLIQSIERAWSTLETSEHAREVALRFHLQKHEKLEQLYYKFEKKTKLRENYLREMSLVLSAPSYGTNLTQIDATVKKHEAISADILSRAERMRDLQQMTVELQDGDFRGVDVVKKQFEEIERLWRHLLELLEGHKVKLDKMVELMGLRREVDGVRAEVGAVGVEMDGGGEGVHLMAVEELLHNHALHEVHVVRLGEDVRRVMKYGEGLRGGDRDVGGKLEEELRRLEGDYKQLVQTCTARKNLLEESRNFYQFLSDADDEQSYLIHQQRLCQTPLTSANLRGILALQHKHKILFDAVSARRTKFDQLKETAAQLLAENHPRSSEIQTHVARIQQVWDDLAEMLEERRKVLKGAAERFQFHAEANEVDSWLKDKAQILRAEDCGRDEPSAVALLKRHKGLEGELKAYEVDLRGLNEQAERLGADEGLADSLPDQSQSSLQLEKPPPEVQLYEWRKVPTEVIEEEEVEKVEYRTMIEERVIKQVKAKYAYKDPGSKFEMMKAEVMYLLNKPNEDWWFVRKTNGTDGFAPANYVEEIEPIIRRVSLKKPETIKVLQKVKKIKLIPTKFPITPPTPTPTPTPQPPPHQNPPIPTRIAAINATYDSLTTLAAQRHLALTEAVQLFQFYHECAAFERWIADKERLLTEPDRDDVTVKETKRKYEKLLTDLSASNNRVDDLHKMVGVLREKKHSSLGEVEKRAGDVEKAWERLNRLKAEKERSLEGASSVELFDKMCEETKEWMAEKMLKMEEEVVGHDLKTVQALQRRHDQLERELAPVEEKVNKVNLLANSVKSSYPSEIPSITSKQSCIATLWSQTLSAASSRRTRLQNLVGQQIFTNSYTTLLSWIHSIKSHLNSSDTPVRDTQTAQTLLKLHSDLWDEIRARDSEFAQVHALGTNLPDESRSLQILTAERAAIERGWSAKQKWLSECLSLQIFNKMADKLNSTTSGHLAYLSHHKMAANLNEIETQIRENCAFANTLRAQDAHFENFARKTHENLIEKAHYDSAAILSKLETVKKQREIAHELARSREVELAARKRFFEFVAQAQDLDDWMTDKYKMAAEETYRELAHLPRKLQKHEAFERELRANESQLRALNKSGAILKDVGDILDKLNTKWTSLCAVSYEKAKRLRQAKLQQSFNAQCDDIACEIALIEANITSNSKCSDLRGCRELISRHGKMEADLEKISAKVQLMRNRASDMRDEGHFDADNLQKTVSTINSRVSALKPKLEAKKGELAAILKLCEFEFAVETHAQWVREHVVRVGAIDVAQNLQQAQNLCKKFEKVAQEIRAHEPAICLTLAQKDNFDKLEPEVEVRIAKSVEKVQKDFDQLNRLIDFCAQKLELSLKAQQFFAEANEVESWLKEKEDVLGGGDFGRDREAATKLLSKHKGLELELDTYSNIIAEMRHAADMMIRSGHPDGMLIGERMSSLELKGRAVCRTAGVRQERLMESLFRHEYFAESEDLDRWIGERLKEATSEDYGRDYEHLLVVKGKFDEVRLKMEVGWERFRQCEALAQKLIDGDSPYGGDIEERQGQLEQSWSNLKAQIEQRSAGLDAAAELHRFHRDVADALERIHSKNAALGSDLGRDLNTALALLRKQETSENELVVLEAHLQVLVEEASRLIRLYPANAPTLLTQQSQLVSLGNALKESADLRAEQLRASVDLQRFLTQLRDLSTWAQHLTRFISSQTHRENSSQLLLNEHEALKSEIDAREPAFLNLSDTLTAMCQTGHFASTEATEKFDGLMGEREKLHKAWEAKKKYLDELFALQMFEKEAKMVKDALGVQEGVLCQGVDEEGGVEGARQRLKKHEEFERLILLQEKGVEALMQSGTKLVREGHFDCEVIESTILEISERRQNLVSNLCPNRKRVLKEALLYAEFQRDVAEVHIWIAEKLKKLGAAPPAAASRNLQDKMQMLQKHQTFQAEVAANLPRIEEVKGVGERLVRGRHKEAEGVEGKLRELMDDWRALTKEVEERGRGLEEAQDILDFNNQLDKIESWIREKELMIQASDTGHDLEHCLLLRRKLDDVDSDMKIDDSRITRLTHLAQKLHLQHHPNILPRLHTFLTTWHSLTGSLTTYRQKLDSAAQIHEFDRQVADTLSRIAEKSHSLSEAPPTGNLSEVESAQRKFDTLNREMSAIALKIASKHKIDALTLSEKFPHLAPHLDLKLLHLSTAWGRLTTLRDTRGELLHSALATRKFAHDLHQLEEWVGEVVGRMHTESSNLQIHADLRAELDNRQITHFRQLESQIASNEELRAKIQALEGEVYSAWEARKEALQANHDAKEVEGKIGAFGAWLAEKEAFLNNEDLGDRLRAVDTLLRKHHEFEVQLFAQLDARLEKLRGEGGGTPLFEKVQKRVELLRGKCEVRKRFLGESRALQVFWRNFRDVEVWVGGRVQVAGDESYREASNLQSKMQKHAAFEAEIAIGGRFEGVVREGRGLIEGGHYASAEIESSIEYLVAEKQNLDELSRIKRLRLVEAYDALLFNRQLDEFESWVGEVEGGLRDDVGMGGGRAVGLLKKHGAVEFEVRQKEGWVEELNAEADEFKRVGHFMAVEMGGRTDELIGRFHRLKEPMQLRRDLLERKALWQQFEREVDDQLQWLREREEAVKVNGDDDLRGGLVAVQRLQKKHQALEGELLSREGIVGALEERARSLGGDGGGVMEKGAELRRKLEEVKDLASVRRLRLQDGVEVQAFYQEVAEAETWMSERKPKLASQEVGNDKDSAQLHQRKLDALALELNTFQATVEKIKEAADKLMERGHFDSETIGIKKTEISTLFSTLLKLHTHRSIHLSESLLYFSFLTDLSATTDYIANQTAHVDSEEYGNDLEHVELLIQAFDTFRSALFNSEPRIEHCLESGRAIVEANGVYAQEVDAKLIELAASWSDLKELANARKEALAGAKQVHDFDKRAEEVKLWIVEKEMGLMVSTYGEDSEAIEMELRRFEGLESEIKAVQGRVEEIERERERLVEEFPDTKEHVDDKYDNTVNAWEILQVKTARRKEELQQAVETQSYFDQYHDLLAWINETLAIITAPSLPQDPLSSELLLQKHDDYLTLITSKLPEISTFTSTGQDFIQHENFRSSEISSKISTIQSLTALLHQIWSDRQKIYTQNLDVQNFKQEAAILETWLLSREANLRPVLGENILQVEELIRKHNDFEQTLHAQAAKFESLRRKTQIEAAFESQRETERANLAAERNLRNLRKTNSFAFVVTQNNNNNNVKRAESLKMKRTPSFTTRRRNSAAKAAPPCEIKGVLERKQVLMAGGRRSGNRAWRGSFTVLCGQLLCFFKNEEDFLASKASGAPVNVHLATVGVAEDYVKRKNVMRLVVQDGAEFLFACKGEAEMEEWIGKVGFRARLPPSQQLLQFDLPKQDVSELEISSQSSRTSSPDVADSSIVYRHPIQQVVGEKENGGQLRHTLGGDSPPPLPSSEPPPTLTEHGRALYGGSTESSPTRSESGSTHTQRPHSEQPQQQQHSINTTNKGKSTSRIMDLFGRKKKSNAATSSTSTSTSSHQQNQQ